MSIEPFTRRTRSALVTLTIAVSQAVSFGVARVDELTANILGTWRCTAAEANGKGDGKEEDDIWTFGKDAFRVESSKGVVECKYQVDASAMPPAIDWESTDEFGNV